VPVPVRLSRRLCEVLGEDLANELVDWFNAVDAGRGPESPRELQQVRTELVFAMFVFWVLNLVGTAGLVMALGWH
jgi:hypothetical protein